MIRRAECACRACHIEVEGDPSLNVVCHCDNCRRRTGSAFGWTGYFDDTRIVSRGGPFCEYIIAGPPKQVRSFCAKCGTTLFWTWGRMPGQTGIAGGAFRNPVLPAPKMIASSAECLDWISLPAEWRRVS